MPNYEELASLTTRYPELLIVRRFDRLSAWILLALQAELLQLEQDLKQYIDLDGANPSLKEFLGSWEDMREGIKDGHPILQVAKRKDLEDRLKTYHETLLRISQVQRLSAPSKQDRSRLWTWLCRPEGGDNFLKGVEADPWDLDGPNYDNISHDLSILRSGPDRLDSWLANTVIPIWHHKIGHRSKANVSAELGLGQLWEYDMKALHLSGNVLCVILSAIGPIVSIQTLYWIPSNIGRLIAITAFIFAFALLMMFVSGCRRFDVFAGTAAFAAIQVVFLQGLNGTVNCS